MEEIKSLAPSLKRSQSQKSENQVSLEKNKIRQEVKFNLNKNIMYENDKQMQYFSSANVKEASKD